MEILLKELRTLPKLKGSLWEHWQSSLQDAFIRNFDQHRPQMTKYAPLDLDWLNNLDRLLGQSPSREKVRKQLKHKDSSMTGQTVFIEIKNERMKKLFDLQCRIQKISMNYCPENQYFPFQLTMVMSHLGCAFLRYDEKQNLLRDILRALKKSKESDPLLIQCLDAAVTGIDLATIILNSVKADQPMQRCLFFADVCQSYYRDSSNTMLQICQVMLRKLSKQPARLTCMLTLGVKRIQIEVRSKRLELNHEMVANHFAECMELLKYCTDDDAVAFLAILNNRLCYYQQYKFPQEDIRRAHVQFEQHRQFYSEVEYVRADFLVRNTYTNTITGTALEEKKLGQRNISELEMARSKQKLLNRSLYRSALKVLREEEFLYQSDNRFSFFRVPSFAIVEVYILIRLGKVRQANWLLLSIRDTALNSNSIDICIQYYRMKAEIEKEMGHYEEAYESCLQVEQLYRSVRKSDRQFMVKHLKGELYCLLGRYRQCIEFINSSPNVMFEIHSSLAEAYRCLGRFSECCTECGYIFIELSKADRDLLLLLSAHLVMMRVAIQLNQPKEEMFHAWSIVNRTTTLGDSQSCIAYTRLIKHYRPLVGDEVLSLISYARRETDPPLERLRATEIAEELYLNPVPAGRLPFDMTIQDFIETAQEKIQSMPPEVYMHCYNFKLELLQALKGKFADQPQFRLLHVRMMIEARLHMLAAGDVLRLLEELPKVVKEMECFQVDSSDMWKKDVLVGFAKCVLQQLEGMCLLMCMPIQDFIIQAHELLGDLSQQEHWEHVESKVNLCNRIMAGPCKSESDIELLALRALVQAFLHYSMISVDGDDACERLFATFDSIRSFRVVEHLLEKQMLVEFAEGVLLKSIEAIEEQRDQ